MYEASVDGAAAGRLWRVTEASVGGEVSAHELLLARPDRRGHSVAQSVEWISAARLHRTRLWLVDHLVRDVRAPGRARAAGRPLWRERRFAFDMARAELEIGAAQRHAAAQVELAESLLGEAGGRGEDATAALEQARMVAEEAAAARRHGDSGIGACKASERRAPRGVIDAEASQVCRYRGMRCAGCGVCFIRGERMQGGGAGFVHRRERCAEAARQELLCVAARDRQSASHAWPPLVSAATVDQARACAVWARLEREYALGGGRAAIEAGGLLLPRHDRDTFIDFLRWMASGDALRLRLVDQVRMAVRAFAAETRLSDWSADSEIAALMEQLARQAAVASKDD